ncbi:MAG: hypothetical protein QJR07_17690 [Acetobacteraceae bacterium]|nr:hypothetical protein [Acetobacteraceae bacterium]
MNAAMVRAARAASGEDAAAALAEARGLLPAYLAAHAALCGPRGQRARAVA